MGLCLRDGLGVAHDLDKALIRFTRAASRGHVRAMVEAASAIWPWPEKAVPGTTPAGRGLAGCGGRGRDVTAMFRLGELFQAGTIPGAPPEEGWTWAARAAEAGHPQAQYLLARRLDLGEGVTAFPLEAAGWYRRAAPQGHLAAMLRLADIYFKGRGVLRDRAAARAGGNWPGRPRPRPGRVVPALRHRGSGRRDMAEAARWCRRAAEDGDASSRYLYGLLLERGLGAPRDELGSAKWLAAAADQGMAEAQYALSLLYLGGRGVIRDAAQAFAWCRKAAEQGLPEAQTLLASMYDEELRSSRNYAQAVRWYRRAAGAGEITAQFNLGSMFARAWACPPIRSSPWSGSPGRPGPGTPGRPSTWGDASDRTGTPQDEEQALAWFLRAAKAGDARSRQGARSCTSSPGDPENPREAFRLARMAAHQGLPQAQAMLGAPISRAGSCPGPARVPVLAEPGHPGTLHGISRDQALAAKARVEKRLSAEQAAQVRERVAAWKPRPAAPARENDGLAEVRFLESPGKSHTRAGEPAPDTSGVFGLF